MKEIKFRQMNNGKFHYWGFINGLFVSPMVITGDDPVNVQSDQYTGLNDKNGKEIYEGDIVNHKHDICQKVIFLNGMFKVPAGRVNDTIPLYYLLDSIEIIGNIHENPELLEAEKLRNIDNKSTT